MEHHLPPLSSPSSEAAAAAPARPLRTPHELNAASAASATVPLPLLLLVEPVVAVPVVPLSYGSGARGRAPLLAVACAPLRRVLRMGPLSVVVEVVTPKTWKDWSAFLQLLRQVKSQIALSG